ncbi:MAG: acetolactate synthase 2 small subunit [Lonepinella koalarum]|nr:acetolactate synthase 2 small subunit [Lonepinella koalarum]
MITTELTIVANHRPETLERIFRVIRHRGFSVEKMQMKLENQKIWCDLGVTGDRPIYLLIHQLVKLHDVIDVTSDEDCPFDE